MDHCYRVFNVKHQLMLADRGSPWCFLRPCRSLQFVFLLSRSYSRWCKIANVTAQFLLTLEQSGDSSSYEEDGLSESKHEIEEQRHAVTIGRPLHGQQGLEDEWRSLPERQLCALREQTCYK